MRGYLIVKINGQHQKIHRLVASAFIEYEQPKDKAVVHHKDRNRKNNNVNNLVWLTVE